MKNTKKAVALALALSVTSQAVPSFAEGVEVKETSDVVAPSTNNALETTVNEKTNEITITQKGIYDLDSGLDVNSVKAYVYEEGSEDKGNAVYLNGNDFSDFTATTKVKSLDSNLVVEVYASDLAGNETEINSKVLVASERASTNNYTGYFFEPGNGYLANNKVTINPKLDFVIGLDFIDGANNLSDIKVILNTSESDCSSGILFSGSINKDSGVSANVNTGSVNIKSSSFENYGYGSTRVNVTIDSSKMANESKYYVWVTDSNGDYKKVEYPIVMDTKAPESTENVDLTLSADNVLFVTMDGVEDSGSNIREVYALIKNDSLSQPERVWMLPNGDSLTTKLYEGSFDLKTLNVAKGEFTVEVYAIDNCGNEGVISTGKISKDMSIESEEVVNIDGQANQENGIFWFGYNGQLQITSMSESLSKVYNGAQIIINEDANDYSKKVLTEFKIGSKEDLTNITDNKYFELMDRKYTTSKSGSGTYDYSNTATALVKFKEGAYNKTVYVWVVYYTDDGIYSTPIKFQSPIQTDYVAPSVTITKESNNYVIKATDNESGIKSVVAYDANGLVIADEYLAETGMVVSEDLNPSTVTVTDQVNNKVIYNVKTGEVIEGVGGTELPEAPAGDDSYVNPDDVVMGGESNGDNNQNPGGDEDGDQTGGDETPGDEDNDQTPGDEDNDQTGGDQTGGDQDGDVDGDQDGDVDEDQTGGDQDGDSTDGDNDQIGDDSTDGDQDDGGDQTGDDSTDGDQTGDDTTNGDQTGGNTNDGTTNGDQNSTTVTPNNGDSSNNNTVATLPQTGGVNSGIVGAIGSLISSIGFVLTRKKK